MHYIAGRTCRMGGEDVTKGQLLDSVKVLGFPTRQVLLDQGYIIPVGDSELAQMDPVVLKGASVSSAKPVAATPKARPPADEGEAAPAKPESAPKKKRGRPKASAE